MCIPTASVLKIWKLLYPGLLKRVLASGAKATGFPFSIRPLVRKVVEKKKESESDARPDDVLKTSLGLANASLDALLGGAGGDSTGLQSEAEQRHERERRLRSQALLRALRRSAPAGGLFAVLVPTRNRPEKGIKRA